MNAEKPDYEAQPLTRGEYITSMVHLYRGEMQRATMWRSRLDATTNWAIIVSVSAVSFTFGNDSHAHIILILSNLIIFMLLWVEARRYRYYDVWRTRLRKMEENFFAPILRRDLQSLEDQWGERMAADLLHPKFKITMIVALRMRLLRNYLVLFLISQVAWWLKLLVGASDAGGGPGQPMDLRMVYQSMALHVIPAWAILAWQVVFYGGLVGILLFVRPPHGYSGEIHEIASDHAFWDR